MRHLHGVNNTPTNQTHNPVPDSSGPASPHTLLTLEDAAKLTQVSKRKLQTEMAAGALAHVKIGRLTRFRPADLQAYIEARIIQRRRRS